MSLTSLTAIASSGLAANQAMLDIAAHNLANLGTDNFHRQDVAQQTQANGGVSVTQRQAEQPGEQMAQDLVDQQVALYNFRANVLALKTGDQALGSLLDLSG